ncbi:hypothetical protein LSH36_255g06007 [Paralvinella palmiformis]|uniref:Uncharacterized protein n=1 Tax=Paralvinella palmiformis TaxID=53620 RepID=A0AAD9JLD7_9ANNE|nr:hypothetical protein LSH36_255g06007 [Paralvinella palmiformis]
MSVYQDSGSAITALRDINRPPCSQSLPRIAGTPTRSESVTAYRSLSRINVQDGGSEKVILTLFVGKHVSLED